MEVALYAADVNKQLRTFSEVDEHRAFLGLIIQSHGCDTEKAWAFERGWDKERILVGGLEHEFYFPYMG